MVHNIDDSLNGDPAKGQLRFQPLNLSVLLKNLA